MLRLTWTRTATTAPGLAHIRASLVSAACLIRGLTCCHGARPGTPLRALCIIALDTLHVLRKGRPLPSERCQAVALFLDFQACANALWDRKSPSDAQYRSLRRRLEQAGLRVWVVGYLTQLRELETRRPSLAGARCRFEEVRSYREAVARLSLAAVTGVALNADSIESAIRSTHCDSDVAALFRMAMQCQIIDDVVDYGSDLSAGLPSFMTGSAPLPRAIALTSKAARSYAPSRGPSAGSAVLPLTAALYLLMAVARLALAVAGRGKAGTPLEFSGSEGSTTPVQRLRAGRS